MSTQYPDYEFILTDRRGPVLIITINRMEKYNALNAQVREELTDVFTAVRTDSEVRAIVLWGGTKAFVAGADLGEMLERKPLGVFRNLSARPDLYSHVISQLPQPVIAAIAGPAFAGGLELAMACDIRIAADNALLGQPEVNVGLIPGAGGTQRLVRLVGMTRAKEMVFLGETLKAQEALQAGLVSRVVPVADLLEEAVTMGKKIAEKAPISIHMAKMMMDIGQDTNLQVAMTMESLAFANMLSTDDMREGSEAFLNKRRANFVGQ